MSKSDTRLPLAISASLRDTYVSTLRRFVAAKGGELRITAHFPQGDIVIS